MDNPFNQSELPRAETAPDNNLGAMEENAPLPSPPALLPEHEGEEIADAGSLEIPTAPAQPPVALLLPTAADHSVIESRIQRLEAELSRMRGEQTVNAQSGHVTNPGFTRESHGFWSNLLGRSAQAKTASQPSGIAPTVPSSVRHTWLLFDALAELRAMYWMFFDPRYYLSWTARLAPLVLVALILTSNFWMPGALLPFFIGTVIEKLCDLILAYFLFKLLSFESRRYRGTAPDLPPSLRL